MYPVQILKYIMTQNYDSVIVTNAYHKAKTR